MTFFTRSKIILLGDSITQQAHSAELSGWGTHLADVYQRRADVYNRGFSGYNTEWILKLLETEEGQQDIFGLANVLCEEDRKRKKDSNRVKSESIVRSSDVSLITVFFGANDASDDKLNPRHHVPLETFKLNLEKIVRLCHKNFGMETKIILITPPPVDHKMRLQYQIDRYGKDNATGKLERTLQLSGLYAEAVVQVANELNLAHLNLWKEMQAARSDWEKFLSDGLHLSREGNIFVGKRLQQIIKDSFNDISVTACPHTGFYGNSGSKGGQGLGKVGGVGPWHDQIDHLDSNKAFEL